MAMLMFPKILVLRAVLSHAHAGSAGTCVYSHSAVGALGSDGQRVWAELDTGPPSARQSLCMPSPSPFSFHVLCL